MRGRPTLINAAGVFVLTAIMFTAAIVIANSLNIPDPARRLLPTSKRGPETVAEAPRPGEDDVDLADDGDEPDGGADDEDESVAVVTAVPTPAEDEAALGGDDDAAGDSTTHDNDATSDDGTGSSARAGDRDGRPSRSSGDAATPSDTASTRKPDDGGGSSSSTSRPRSGKSAAPSKASGEEQRSERAVGSPKTQLTGEPDPPTASSSPGTSRSWSDGDDRRDDGDGYRGGRSRNRWPDDGFWFWRHRDDDDDRRWWFQSSSGTRDAFTWWP